MPDGAVEIGGVPQRNGCGNEGQARGAMKLVLEGAVVQLAETVEEEGAGKGVAGLTLVEHAAGTTTLRGIVEPVEHEQGALDPPNLAQCAGDRVLARKACQLACTLTGQATSGRKVGHGSNDDRPNSRRSLKSRMRSAKRKPTRWHRPKT